MLAGNGSAVRRDDDRLGRLSAGVIAATCGTAALNVATYLDMTARGRPASRLPARAADQSATGLSIDLGEGETRQNRSEGLGALMGYAAGLSAGSIYLLGGRDFERIPLPIQAAALTVAAMLVGNVPAMTMGLTDPRRWSGGDWLADILPHAAYGLVGASVYRVVRGRVS
jgi:hypothetical protein